MAVPSRAERLPKQLCSTSSPRYSFKRLWRRQQQKQWTYFVHTLQVSKYQRIVEWMKDLIFNTQFTAERYSLPSFKIDRMGLGFYAKREPIGHPG